MDKPQALQQTSKIPGKQKDTMKQRRKDRKTERKGQRQKDRKTERKGQRQNDRKKEKKKEKMQLNAAGTCGQMLAIGQKGQKDVPH